MSWEDATSFLEEYREEREKALNNEEHMKWSTHNVSSLGELVEKFNSDAENSEWQGLYAEPYPDVCKMLAVRTKINFLAGCRRDARIQFACRGGDRMRVWLDHCRFEYMRLAFNNMRMEVLQDMVEDLEAGAEVV